MNLSFLMAFLFLFVSATAGAYSIKLEYYGWTETLKNSYGEIAYMNDYEASRACKALGGHLPTALEWARFTSQLGTSIIRTPAEYKGEPGFQLVSYWYYQNIDTYKGSWTNERFYYEFTGYMAPGYEIEKIVFWTNGRAINPAESGMSRDEFIVFDGRDGYIRTNKYGGDYHAVRCKLDSN